jgi:hypothetical protein
VRTGRRAVLHIGTEKTGTTALQEALAASAPLLAEHGWRYPDLGPDPSHAALACYAADRDEDVEDIAAMAGVRPAEDRAAFSERLERRLTAEVAAHPEARFLFSTEHGHSRLVTPTAVERLRALLSRYFDEVDVLVYLRRWDRLDHSMYSTLLRDGETRRFAFGVLLRPEYFDYVGMLERWAAVFGAKRLSVAIHDRGSMMNGSILDDVSACLGLPSLPPRGRTNEALGGRGRWLLREVNLRLGDVDPARAATVRWQVIEALEGTEPGPSARPARADAVAFVRGFDGQAAWIRDRYFPGRERLFDDGFDEYPEQEEVAGPDAREIVDVMTTALLNLALTEPVARDADQGGPRGSGRLDRPHDQGRRPCPSACS